MSEKISVDATPILQTNDLRRGPSAEYGNIIYKPSGNRVRMLSFFSIPRAFVGEFDVIQRNAIESWTRLKPPPQVILLGRDTGVSEVVSQYGLDHIPEIATNEFGTPLLDSAFARAQRVARHELVCYISTDIILMSDFAAAVERIARTFTVFLGFGQRLHTTIRTPIDFGPKWEQEMRTRIEGKNSLLGSALGLDYFVMPKWTFQNIPAFAVGRAYYDNWLIYSANSSRVPTIDLTDNVLAIHQIHGGPSKTEEQKRNVEQETMQNLLLAGGGACLHSALDAQFRLTKKGLSRNLASYLLYQLVDPRMTSLVRGPLTRLLARNATLLFRLLSNYTFRYRKFLDARRTGDRLWR